MSHQYLNTESIFEVIGNYPVVDQFDVLYSALLTGSYTDNYITGSMLSRTRNASGVGEILIPGDRRLAFSKLGVDRTQTPIILTDTSQETSYQLQPWWERSGVQRCVRIFSNDERFYDSLLPNLTKMLKVDGGAIAISAGLPFITIGHFSSGEDVTETVRAVGFIQSFPFEPKYSSIERVKRLSDSLTVTYDIEEDERIDPALVKGAAIFEFYGGAVPATINALWTSFSNDFESSLAPLDSFSVASVLFGIGDRTTAAVSPGFPGYPTGSIGTPQARKKVVSAYSYLNGPIVRGWKYGLHDAHPHYTSCVFRRDRFGQFRDMLEQRLHPATLIDGENSPSSISLFAEEPTAMPHTNPTRNTFSQNLKNSNTQYPVTVKFVRQQINTDKEGVNTLAYPSVNPNETWSSNMSNYATSSVPYFDLDNNSLGRNRGEIPQTVLNPELVFTTV